MSHPSRFLVGITLAVAMVLAATMQARAESPGAKVEIAQLRDFVRTSACRFVRNGTEYAATQALDHMDMKAERIGKRIQGAEDWIEFAASRSSQSGKPYLIRCPGQPEVESGAWLRAELDRVRAKRADPPPP